MSYVNLIPGYTFSPGETITLAKLNAAAQPIVSLDSSLFYSKTLFKNLLHNSTINVNQRGSGIVIAPDGTRTYRPDRWFVLANGGEVEFGPVATPMYPTSATAIPMAISRHAGPANYAIIGQRLEANDINSMILGGSYTFSCYIKNMSLGLFSPNLVLSTPTAIDDWTGSDVQATIPMQPAPVGQWTRIQAVFDAGSIPNLANGLEVAIELSAGALSGGSTDRIYFADIQLEKGDIPTAIEIRPYAIELMLCQRYALVLTNQVIGFADNATNLYNKGLLTLPTTMRIKPEFEGTPSLAGTEGAHIGTPVISGWCNNVLIAFANADSNWDPGAQVILSATLSADL